METRAVPTPGDLAHGRTQPARATPPAPSYDRHRWEQELIAADLPHSSALLLGWGLAHQAWPSGYLPPRAASVEQLSRTLRLTARQVGMSLPQLEEAGLIRRPERTAGQPRGARAIRLTLPQAVARTEPPSTGEAAE